MEISVNLSSPKQQLHKRESLIALRGGGVYTLHFKFTVET